MSTSFLFLGEKCFDSAWFATLCAFIFIVLLPILPAYRIKKDSEAYLKVDYAPFTMAYTRECWYYELVLIARYLHVRFLNFDTFVCFRRICLALVFVLPIQDLVMVRFLFAVVIGIFLSLHGYLMPFAKTGNNTWEIFLQVSLIIVTFSTTIASESRFESLIKIIVGCSIAIPTVISVILIVNHMLKEFGWFGEP